MTLRVATALTDATLESSVVQEVMSSSLDITVVRRCRDVVELRAVVHASQVDTLIVDGGLRGVDRDVVSGIVALGVRIIVVSESAEAWRLLGVHEVVGRDLKGLLRALGQASATGPLVAVRPDRPHESAGRVVALWGPAGAPGRTTISIELAACLSRRGQDVLLVDLDTMGPSVAQQLGLIDDTSGLAAAVRSAAHGAIEPTTLASLAVSVPSGPRVLVGLPATERWTELRPASTEAVLQAARATVPWTVIDVGSGIEGDDLDWVEAGSPKRFGAARTAIAHADVVVCVGRPDPVGLARLLRETPKVHAIAPTAEIQVIFNRVRSRGEAREARELVSAVLGARTIDVPEQAKSVTRAVALGCPIAEVAAGSPLVSAVDGLAAHLLDTFPSYDPAGEHTARTDRRFLRSPHRRHRHRDAGVV